MALGAQNHGIGSPTPCHWPRLARFICTPSLPGFSLAYKRCGKTSPRNGTELEGAPVSRWAIANEEMRRCLMMHWRRSRPCSRYRSGTAGRPHPPYDGVHHMSIAKSYVRGIDIHLAYKPLSWSYSGFYQNSYPGNSSARKIDIFNIENFTTGRWTSSDDEDLVQGV
jgi:hypothetical protein